MSLETLTLEHLPAGFSVHLAMFQGVKNAAFLHQQLLARNASFEYAFVDASVIISRVQLLSAIFRASWAAAQDSLKTPNVHSETVVSLSSSSNIADAYRRFGISPSTKDLIVVKITYPGGGSLEPPSAQQIWDHLKANVEGEAVSPTDDVIFSTADLPKVRKYYKLNGLKWLDSIQDKESTRLEMEKLILAAMALRGV